jgi:nitrous oxidase accessory protein
VRRFGVLALVLPLLHGDGKAQIVVSPEGPVRSVAVAVRQAAPGTTILVRAGTYHEGPIVIDRAVELIGEGRPRIVGRGDYTLVRVTADSVRLRGLVLGGVAPSHIEDRAVLKLEGVRHCELTDLEIRDGYFGIYLAETRDCLLERNRVLGPGGPERQAGNAIHLWSSERIRLIDNQVSGHRDGLYFEFVKRAVIRGNTSSGNSRYGLHFMFSDDCEYRDNTFRRNGAGIAVMYTRRIRIENNRFEENEGPTAYGLLLKDISDSRLAGNRFRRNTVGLLAEGGGRLEVVENHFEDNGWAIRLMANSMDNRFTGNVFAGNSFDLSTNSQSNYSSFSGNWWDRYRGYDLDRDGRGDVGYRPVRLFSLLVARHPPALILLRSGFVDLLDLAERVLPVLTPETLVDDAPLMERPR